jgi:hypothetical protein
MRLVHQIIVYWIRVGMTLSFLFGAISLPGIVGSTQAATLLPSSVGDPIVKVLDSTHPRVPQPGGVFESRCGGGCVHDRSTGFFWESTPVSTPQTLSQAGNHCSSLNSLYPPSSLTNDTNARARGWSLPYIWELATLPDPTLTSSSVSPDIFFNVQKSQYWALGGSNDPYYARLFGGPFGGIGVVQKSVNLLVWCVLSPFEFCSSEHPCTIP